MNHATIIDDPDFVPTDAPALPQASRVLFAEPTHFDVAYVINAHMAGHVGHVDTELAFRQWEAVVAAYKAIGFEAHVVEAAPGLPDLCFVANQSFPLRRTDGSHVALLSNMTAPQRRPEVEVLAEWYAANGWETVRLPRTTVHFEGMGDAVWHPGHRVVYGGYGWRTHQSAYLARTYTVDAPVVALELCDARFYHLDTCFAALDAETALYVPEAFTPVARRMLQRCFPKLLRVPLDEAVDALACNGHCPDQKHFIVDQAAPKTMALVREAGFEAVGVDTSEFRKSGGSVQCLKLMLG